MKPCELTEQRNRFGKAGVQIPRFNQHPSSFCDGTKQNVKRNGFLFEVFN